jgi:hypothetical protein
MSASFLVGSIYNYLLGMSEYKPQPHAPAHFVGIVFDSLYCNLAP